MRRMAWLWTRCCSNQSPLVLCTTAVNAAAKQPRHVVRVSTWLGEDTVFLWGTKGLYGPVDPLAPVSPWTPVDPKGPVAPWDPQVPWGAGV